MSGKTVSELPADGPRRRPRSHLVEVDLAAGPNELQLAFLNDAYVEAIAATRVAPLATH